MARITLGERVAAAFVGAVFGAILGFIVAWLAGVYSRTAGPSHIGIPAAQVVALSAAAFAVIGLVTGSFVGSLLGSVFNVLYQAERGEEGFNPAVPTWLAVVVLLGVVGVAVWLASN